MTLFDFSFLGFHIVATWYGLMYALGFGICFYYIERYGYLKKSDGEDFLVFLFLGVILGGRIGYVVLYQLDYFVSHPLEILMIWKGGMSFHGGAIGVIIALILFAKRYRYRLFDLSDPLVAILPIALGLGRIGNYLNGELLGYTPYSGPWSMIQDGMSHFPSPLFEAGLEGILLFLMMQSYRYFEYRTKRIPGYASALFLIGYGVLRTGAEFLRLPDAHIGYLFSTEWITLGMIYSLPMIFLGIIIFLGCYRSRKEDMISARS